MISDTTASILIAAIMAPVIILLMALLIESNKEWKKIKKGD
jgi:hypothetical protein